MAFDNLVLKKIASETDEAIRGAFFDVPFALGENQYALPFHASERLKSAGGTGRGTLILCLDPTRPFFTYSEGKFSKATDNTPFFNSLRRLTGLRALRVTKAPGERIVTVDFERVRPEIGDVNESYSLVLELFPSRCNAFLLGQPSGKIVSLYKERGDITSSRFLTRNSKYAYPPKRAEFDSAVSSLEEAKPLLAKEVFKRLEKRAADTGFEKARDELIADPGLYFAPGTVLPARLGDAAAKPVRASQIYECFVEDQKSLTRALKEKDLTQKITRALKTAEKKLKNLREDYQDSLNKLCYKDWGNLLYLYQTEYKPKSSSVTLEGVQIPLDPKKDLVENANLYFKRYKKAKVAVETLKELEKDTMDEIDYLKKKSLEIPKATNRDLVELKAELVMEGYLKDPSRRYKTSRNKACQPHYVYSKTGAKIGFGNNGLQNETLTFKIAQPHDLFFHVKDYPGAHVAILNGVVDDESRLFAGELACWLSDLPSGDVMVAERRRVKKNPKRIGLVNVLDYTTIHVPFIREESIQAFKAAMKG